VRHEGYPARLRATASTTVLLLSVVRRETSRNLPARAHGGLFVCGVLPMATATAGPVPWTEATQAAKTRRAVSRLDRSGEVLGQARRSDSAETNDKGGQLLELAALLLSRPLHRPPLASWSRVFDRTSPRSPLPCHLSSRGSSAERPRSPAPSLPGLSFASWSPPACPCQ